MLQISSDDGAFRSHDLGTNVVAVTGLHVVFDCAEHATRKPHIKESGVNIVKLCNLRINKNCAVRMNLRDFVVHEPPSQIELVDGGVLKKHAVYAAGHVDNR